MVVRPYDCLILWLSDTPLCYLATWNLMIVWPYDRPTLWSSDLMIVRPYDCLTLWSSELMIVQWKWRTYDLTLWLSGENAELMIWPYDCPCWWLSCWWLSANPCLIYVDRKACLPIVILSVFIIQRRWWWGVIIIITFIHLISLQFLSFLFTCWWRACLLSPNSRTREWFCLWQKGMRNYASIMEVLILLPALLILFFSSSTI